MDTFERYRLGVALAGLVIGLVPALADRRGPAWLRARAVGLAVAAAAVLSVVEGPMRPVAAALAALACLARGDDGGRGHPLGPETYLLVLASLGGVWVSVPDVEPALAAAGCLIPIAIVRVVRRASPGRVDSLLLVAAVIGAAVVGSAGRTTALSAAATVGMVAAAPLAVRTRRQLPPAGIAALGVVHLVTAVPVGRLVMRAEPLTAVVVAVGSFGVQLAAAAAADRIAGSDHREGRPGHT